MGPYKEDISNTSHWSIYCRNNWWGIISQIHFSPSLTHSRIFNLVGSANALKKTAGFINKYKYI